VKERERESERLFESDRGLSECFSQIYIMIMIPLPPPALLHWRAG